MEKVYLVSYNESGYEYSYTTLLKAFKLQSDAEDFIEILKVEIGIEHIKFDEYNEKSKLLSNEYHNQLKKYTFDNRDKNYKEKINKNKEIVEKINVEFYEKRKELHKDFDFPLKKMYGYGGLFEVEEVEFVD
jgi:hypothetical protein